MQIHISIADDHPLVVKGLQYLLANSADMVVTGTYPDGAQLLAGLETNIPDVLLLDIHMPGQTGDELAEIITRQYPDTKIIALTNEDNVYYIKTMFSKGVHGYILKTTGEEILLDAIRTVHEGGEYLEASLKDKLTFDTLQARKLVYGKPVLTRREKEVLQHLTKNLTSQQIADILCISKKTVESHRMNLLVKLDVKNAAALITKGIQLGLI